MDKASFGKWAEQEAARHLMAKGWALLDSGVHFREGEIDLIMEQGRELLFVEVKGRRSKSFGDVVESLTASKVRRLKKAMVRWRQAHEDRRPGTLLFVGIFVDQKGKVKMETYPIE